MKKMKASHILAKFIIEHAKNLGAAMAAPNQHKN